MKSALFYSLLLITYSSVSAQEAKILSDCTVFFELSVNDPAANADIVKSMMGTTLTVYIKGSRSRRDLENPSFKQITFNDSKSDTTIILREVGSAKYITYLDEAKRKERYKNFENITFTETGETKTILGYSCTKTVARLNDGSTYNVYYTTAVAPSNTEYEYQFRNIPGFVLEYESETENKKVRVNYTAVKISLTPVPNAIFDVPKAGYRILQ